jgi:hypothetical protein
MMESRREMTRRHWRNPDTTLEGYYGLGIINGHVDGWTWFGHSGAMPGYITRTATLVEPAAQPGEQVDGLPAGQVGPQLDVAGDVGEAAVQCDGVVPGIAAEQPGGPGVGAQQTQQNTDGGGLARAVGAEEAVDLAGLHREVESVQGPGLAEGLDQAGCGDGGCYCGHGSETTRVSEVSEYSERREAARVSQGYDERRHALAEELAGLLIDAGMQRMASRVYAHLFMDDEGVRTAAELAERLRVSPGAISGAVGYLSQVYLLTRERQPGSRRER